MSDAKPCPKCGSWAQESGAIEPLGKRSVLGGYYWHCANDPYSGVPTDDCEFTGPIKPTSAEALLAWNELAQEEEINARVILLQARLKSAGIRDIHFSKDEKWNEFTWEQRATSVCDALEAYLNGQCTKAVTFTMPTCECGLHWRQVCNRDGCKRTYSVNPAPDAAQGPGNSTQMREFP